MTSRFDGVITPLHRHKEGQLRGAFDDGVFSISPLRYRH